MQRSTCRACWLWTAWHHTLQYQQQQLNISIQQLWPPLQARISACTSDLEPCTLPSFVATGPTHRRGPRHDPPASCKKVSHEVTASEVLQQCMQALPGPVKDGQAVVGGQLLLGSLGLGACQAMSPRLGPPALQAPQSAVTGCVSWYCKLVGRASVPAHSSETAKLSWCQPMDNRSACACSRWHSNMQNHTFQLADGCRAATSACSSRNVHSWTSQRSWHAAWVLHVQPWGQAAAQQSLT